MGLGNPLAIVHWKCFYKCRNLCKQANVPLIRTRSDINDRKANIGSTLLWEQSSESLNSSKNFYRVALNLQIQQRIILYMTS